MGSNGMTEKAGGKPDMAAKAVARRGWRELLVFALAPGIVGALTLASWLLGLRQAGASYLPAGLALAAVLLGGWQRFLAGFRDAARRRITVNVFVTVALSVTLAAGEFLPAAVIILIMAVVGALEAYTLDSTRRSIRGLLELTPPEANVRRDGAEVAVPAAELRQGDIVIVRPGERIPVDGVVEAGASAVNQAPVTGESMPVEKSKGHAVFAGTLNEDGRLEILTARAGEDTTLARIVHLVEEAQESRAPVQGTADRFTAWFLPIVLLLAVAGYLVSGETKIAVAILLVACPCAFAIATPSAVAAGIANMARRAVLIKGGIFFELAGRIDTLVVDKTGTMTLGRPKVMEVVPGAGVTEEEVVSLAAAAEKYSEHPLAQAVTVFAAQRGLVPQEPDGFRAEAGKGVAASCGGREIVVGKEAFLRERGVAVPASLQAAATAQAELGRTVIMVARDREAVGLLSVADEVKAGTAEAIGALKSLGVRRTLMLTGDDRRIAAAVAAQIGVEEFRAGLLPEEKHAAVGELRKKGAVVAMLGDGINDAPALALADIGIAMGGAGVDAAIEASDVVLMDGDLSRLVEFMQMSRKVLRRIKLNIFFSIIYNAAGLALALLGHLTPVMAVIFQEAGCVTVVVSSTLLLRARVPGLRAAERTSARARDAALTKT